MDAQELISYLRDFLEKEYYSTILEQSRKGNRYLALDFKKLIRFNIEISEMILDDPENNLSFFSQAISTFDIDRPDEKFEIRLKNLPESQMVRIRDVRSKHISKLLYLRGIIRQKSEIRPLVISARFECPSCGQIITVIQNEKKFKEPKACGCGRKGKTRLISKETIDAQRIYLEESSDDLEGSEQPKRIQVYLKKDLTDINIEQRTAPGTYVIINGILKEMFQTTKSGGQSTELDIFIDAVNVEPVEDEQETLKITKNDLEKIKEVSKSTTLLKDLINSVAPNVYGNDRVKEGIILQILGGAKRKKKDGVKIRGDIHILLVGDPGTAKSQFLKRVNQISPRSRFISGKGVSGAGLTASVIKDDFMGGWALEAGALVLSHKGIVCIDELDKIGEEQTSAMHEALEGQTVTISKASIQATLKCETTVLAAANPKAGRFDQYSKTLAEQIDLPVTLINRFDLIFPFKDTPSAHEDLILAKFIVEKRGSSEDNNPAFETSFLKKYFHHAKKLCPEISKDVVQEMAKYFSGIRNQNGNGNGNKAMAISARQLEAIARLSEAYAKLRLSNKVNIEDFEKAKDMMEYCLREVAYDQETGKVDIDRIETGITTNERNQMYKIKEVIKSLNEEYAKNIPYEEIIKLAEERGIRETKAEYILEKLKGKGEIYESKKGFIRLL